MQRLPSLWMAQPIPLSFATAPLSLLSARALRVSCGEDIRQLKKKKRYEPAFRSG